MKRIRPVKAWMVVWKGRIWPNDGHASRLDADEECRRCRLAGDDEAHVIRVLITPLPALRRGRKGSK